MISTLLPSSSSSSRATNHPPPPRPPPSSPRPAASHACPSAPRAPSAATGATSSSSAAGRVPSSSPTTSPAPLRFQTAARSLLLAVLARCPRLRLDAARPGLSVRGAYPCVLLLLASVYGACAPFYAALASVFGGAHAGNGGHTCGRAC
eukprot:3026780-Rhodomonas_salina.1